MLNMFSLSKLPWMSGTDGQEKVVLTAAEVESLRSELAAFEEKRSSFQSSVQVTEVRILLLNQVWYFSGEGLDYIDEVKDGLLDFRGIGHENDFFVLRTVASLVSVMHW
ncbi:hypothetical protein HAX54_017414 [Datura stramonium]|uniref:Uncharacterized protein n=1 Tax=Datura stramonium TaxID=4076 RepID=A0ABS8ULX9_DATST|nr:hypothetical protein [Datura stramonium]